METLGYLTPNRVLDHHAAEIRHRPFLVSESIDGRWKEWTYEEFALDVNRCAASLRSLGIRQGDRVIIHSNNRPEFLISYFAINRLGAICVPTVTHYSIDELSYVAEQTGATALLFDSPNSSVAKTVAMNFEISLVALLGQSDSETATGDWHAWSDLVEQPADLVEPSSGPEAVAAIMYSSGTTARPKGVVITNGAAVASGQMNAEHQRLQPCDTHLCVLPVFHGNAMFLSAMPTFMTGARLALIEQFSAKRFLSQARVFQATAASLVPTAIRHILSQPKRASDDNNLLRFVLYGLTLTEDELCEFETRFATRLVNVWGMTENIATGTRSPLYLPRRPHTVGLSMSGTEHRLVDDSGHEVADGEVGELEFRGGPMSSGYFRDQDATDLSSDGDWFKTGDNCRKDEFGYYVFVDRKKDMIKVKGENVAASEVERVLLGIPGVQEAAVVGLPDPVTDERVVAYIVIDPQVEVTVEQMDQVCGSLLANFKTPREFHIVSELPKTSIGKVRKVELRSTSPAGLSDHRSAL